MDVRMIGGQPSKDSVAVPLEEVVVYPTFGAAAVVGRPEEYGQRGHYAFGAITAAVAFAAAAHVFAMRVVSDNSFFFLKKLTVGIAPVTAVTAQFGGDIDAKVLRGFSTAHTTNTTAVLLSDDTGKMDQQMGTSLLEVKVSTAVAAGMTGNVATEDTNPFAVDYVPGVVGLSTGRQCATLFDCVQMNQHPLRLGYQEGIVVRNTTLWATGTVKFYINVVGYEAKGI